MFLRTQTTPQAASTEVTGRQTKQAEPGKNIRHVPTREELSTNKVSNFMGMLGRMDFSKPMPN